MKQLVLFGTFWEIKRSRIPGRWIVGCLCCGLHQAFDSLFALNLEGSCETWAWTHNCRALR